MAELALLMAMMAMTKTTRDEKLEHLCSPFAPQPNRIAGNIEPVW
jgi:hypothetical protein